MSNIVRKICTFIQSQFPFDQSLELHSVFSDYYSKQRTPSEGFYRIIYQIMLQNSCEVNSKSISDMIRDGSNK